jgi:hypothetical protein
MTKRITLCYRKIIDIDSKDPWDELVFNATYAEFLLQAQYYNQQQQYHTFAQLIQHVPGAAKLHFLVSSACTGYLQQFNEQIPGIYNILGQQFLKFNSFKFEIINSAMNSHVAHRVAINFYSRELLWHDTIGNYLLVSDAAQNAAHEDEGILTNLVQLVPFLSIYNLSQQ